MEEFVSINFPHHNIQNKEYYPVTGSRDDAWTYGSQVADEHAAWSNMKAFNICVDVMRGNDATSICIGS